MQTFKDLLEFEWDKGNIDKNKKHNVENSECEEVFFDVNKVVFKDKLHSLTEERVIVLGETKKNRLLYVVFTKRKNKIRVISARNVNKKEVNLYEKRA